MKKNPATPLSTCDFCRKSKRMDVTPNVAWCYGCGTILLSDVAPGNTPQSDVPEWSYHVNRFVQMIDWREPGESEK